MRLSNDPVCGSSSANIQDVFFSLTQREGLLWSLKLRLDVLNLTSLIEIQFFNELICPTVRADLRGHFELSPVCFNFFVFIITMQLLLVPRTRWFCFRPSHTCAAGTQVTPQPSASVYLFVQDAFRDDAAKKVHELKWVLLSDESRKM